MKHPVGNQGKEDALTKTYDLILWLFPKIAKFPRDHRYMIGDRIRTRLLDIQEKLIEARFIHQKRALLFQINIALEQLRHHIRLILDMRLITMKEYEYTSRELNAVGMFVGGWIKSLERRSNRPATA